MENAQSVPNIQRTGDVDLEAEPGTSSGHQKHPSCSSSVQNGSQNSRVKTASVPKAQSECAVFIEAADPEPRQRHQSEPCQINSDGDNVNSTERDRMLADAAAASAAEGGDTDAKVLKDTEPKQTYVLQEHETFRGILTGFLLMTAVLLVTALILSLVTT